MFKKFISMATAVLLMATCLSVLAASPASANLVPVGTNIPLGSDQPVAGQLGSFTSGWTAPNQGRISSVTWSPALTDARFAANTVYSAIVTVTPVAFISEFQSTNANTFTVSNGAATGTTVTHGAITQGASSAVITIAFPATGELPTRVITSTSTLTAGQVNPQVIVFSSGTMNATPSTWTINVGTTGLTWFSINTQQSGRVVFTFRGTSTSGTLTVQGSADAFFNSPNVPSNTLSFVVTGGSSSSQQSSAQAQAAAAAAAATAFSAGQKLTKTVSAQQNLSSAFLGSKPGSIEDFRSANINVTTTASLNRINAEILKLSAIDRTDFAKIKALAEKIEFDESFFNASSRPTAATYAAYGVPGVTERVVAKVNEKVLALPAAQRLDTKAITEIANVESFVDRVANTATRSSVSTNLLISKGLVSAEYPKKHSLLLGLGNYPEGSLNTMAKIEAAIKEQIAKAEAPRLRTAEIRARIAARRG